jgi:hypothetical protein
VLALAHLFQQETGWHLLDPPITRKGDGTRRDNG